MNITPSTGFLTGLNNLVNNFSGPIFTITSALGLIIGIHSLMGIANEHKTNSGYRGHFIGLCIGSILIALGSFVQMAGNTLGIQGAVSGLAYNPAATSASTTSLQYVYTAYNVITLGGWFAVIKGLFMVYHMENNHHGDHSFAKAFVFIVFGTACANIIVVLGMIHNQFSITFPGIN